MSFACRTNGRKTQVNIFDDRIESWQISGVSPCKITAGILTCGLSLILTGIGEGSYGTGSIVASDVIQLDTITGVASNNRDGYSTVAVSTPTAVIPWIVSEAKARQVVDVVNGLIGKAKQPEAASPPQVVVSAAAAGSGPSDAATIQAAQLAALSSPHIMANLEKLADMRYKRLISDEEFAAMKAKLLGS